MSRNLYTVWSLLGETPGACFTVEDDEYLQKFWGLMGKHLLIAYQTSFFSGTSTKVVSSFMREYLNSARREPIFKHYELMRQLRERKRQERKNSKGSLMIAKDSGKLSLTDTKIGRVSEV